ncbi:DUF1488 family protein [Bradyrhizobium macuxiense]|uniref:DUF1488 family protein n=1 Tax=Bradyrhizobium macuxiense TaxID=1755647 RepID=UPI0011BE74BF
MHLTSGTPIGYDPKWMVYRFTMFIGNRSVDCEISNAALSALGEMRENPRRTHESVFRRHRKLIEGVASSHYRGDPGPVRIFAKHLPSPRARGRRSARRPPSLRSIPSCDQSHSILEEGGEAKVVLAVEPPTI